MNDLGVNSVRLDIRWESWEISGSSWLTPVIDRLTNNGQDAVNIVGVLANPYGSPSQYAWDGGYEGHPDFDHCDSGNTEACVPDGASWNVFKSRFLDEYVTPLLQQYTGVIEYWSIWNEPNEPSFFKPYVSTTYPNQYSARLRYEELVAAACPIVRQYGGKCMGPVAAVYPENSPSDPNRWSGDRSYVQNVINAVGSHIDIVDVHIYGEAAPFYQAVSSLRSAVGASREFWVTETNFAVAEGGYFRPSHHVGRWEREIAVKVQDMLDGTVYPLSGSLPDAMFYYSIVDCTAPDADQCPSWYTIWDDWYLTDLARAPYWAMKQILAGTYSAPATGFCTRGSQKCAEDCVYPRPSWSTCTTAAPTLGIYVRNQCGYAVRNVPLLLYQATWGDSTTYNTNYWGYVNFPVYLEQNYGVSTSGWGGGYYYTDNIGIALGYNTRTISVWTPNCSQY
jgi:hypothetical protein